MAKPSTPGSAFAAALNAEIKSRQSKCPFAAQIEGLSETEVAEIERSLSAPIKEVSNVAIREALKTIGITVSRDALQQHRRRKCRCGVL